MSVRGWTSATLGEVLPLIYGKALQKKVRTVGNVPVYGSSGVVGMHSKPLTSGPTLIVGRKGNVGEAHLSAVPCWPIDTVYFAEGSPSTNLQFFYYLLQFRNLRSLDRSTAVPGLSRDDYNRVEIGLPPQPEQQRIVDAIDSYLTRLDDAVASLERVQAKLKTYRASVLKAAMEGRMVPTEAALARTEKRAYEPAETLLARILKERRRRWEEVELSKLKAARKAPKNDKWKGRYREPLGPVTKTSPRLPEGWCWATIGQLAQLVTDGDHNPPRRESNGIPHLTAKHIKEWRISFKNCSFVSPQGFEQTKRRYEPCEGDVIVTCVGTVGETAVVPANCVFSADRNLAAIRLVPGAMLPAFVMYLLSSPNIRRRIMTCSGATAQPHLYLGDLQALVVPIPPRPEQDRIVNEIERLLTIVDASEALVGADVKRSGRLRQAILMRAFQGKLVDQDSSDEPADKLLAHIRAERAATTAIKRSRGSAAKERHEQPE